VFSNFETKLRNTVANLLRYAECRNGFLDGCR
jgi:hypothetical protein